MLIVLTNDIVLSHPVLKVSLFSIVCTWHSSSSRPACSTMERSKMLFFQQSDSYQVVWFFCFLIHVFIPHNLQMYTQFKFKGAFQFWSGQLTNLYDSNLKLCSNFEISQIYKHVWNISMTSGEDTSIDCQKKHFEVFCRITRPIKKTKP